MVVAAMRRSLLTYEELGIAIGITGINLRNQMRHVLDHLSRDCIANGEPSLAVLVVNQSTGEPGSGFRKDSMTWAREVRSCYRWWQPSD